MGHEVADGATFDASYYEKYYGDYVAQNPDRKLAYYLRMIDAHCMAPRPRSLLDVGCGLGRFLEFMRDVPGWTLHGADVNADAIERNAARWPDISFTRATATEDPYPPSTFDVITALDVVEHVPDTDAVAAAAVRMLKPGGLFLLVVPVYDGPTGPIIHLLDKDPTHIHKWGRDAWLAWTARHFEVLEWRGALRYLLPGKLYLHWPTKLLRRATPSILVVARRR